MKGAQRVLVSVGAVRKTHPHVSLHVCNQSSSIEACMPPPPSPPPPQYTCKQGAVVQLGGRVDVAPI